MKIDIISHYLDTYAMGVFPMADARDADEIYWVQPEMRGIIPLDKFNVPRSLKNFMKTCDYYVTINEAFEEVIHACAEIPRHHETNTWINGEIESVFITLHHAGHAHSIEIWDRKNGELVGGLYGLAQGGCFNGESMFSRAQNTSKIALVHLVEHLNTKGFSLLDTQFINDHLKQFGCIEISHDDYMRMLHAALKQDVIFL